MKLGEVKVGLSQTNMPAPLNYRKFLNAMIVVIIPALSTFIMGLKLEEYTKYIIAQSFILLMAILKGLGMLIGNGQQYVPSNEAVEKTQNEQ